MAPEFVSELQRTSSGAESDHVLKLARQLPRLPNVDPNETQRMASLVHDIVFVAKNLADAGSARSLSDARHLAQAALARASGYVTSDGKLLEARAELFEQIGIDVASLDEFDALLPADGSLDPTAQLLGTEIETKALAAATLRGYLGGHRVAPGLISEFAPDPQHIRNWKCRAIVEAGEVVGVGACVGPDNIDGPARILVHVRADHVACETFADHLLDTQIREACMLGPVTIELPSIVGQGAVRRAAALRGFLAAPNAETLVKVALGRPVTKSSWPGIARQTRRRTGLRLPEAPPDAVAAQSGLAVHCPDGRAVMVRLGALEDALAPTILAWPGREGVIVPIARNYADDLLGTSDQYVLFGRPEAAFVARRTYFNSPRTGGLMRPGVPILFYESKRSGGRGAVVAAARIVDATVMAKAVVPDDLLRRAVVEDLEPLSTSDEVLATSFDNLLRFPDPVSLDKLRQIGAVGSANLQTSSSLTAVALAAILDMGWSRA